MGQVPLEEMKNYTIHQRTGFTITESTKHHFAKDIDFPMSKKNDSTGLEVGR
jgi:hypothetical protein